MPPKKKHRSASLERHVRATRDHTWATLLAELESATGYVEPGDPPPHGVGAVLHVPFDPVGPPLVETVISFEPPWRRVYRLEGDTGLDLYEGTFALRDDGDECHLAWAVVADPEPSTEGEAFLERAIAAIGGFLDRIVAAAEA